MTNISKSIIRSVSSIVVGAVVALLGHVGLNAFSAQAAAYVAPAVAAGYAVLVRLIEAKVPVAGWLLGVPGAPSYSPKHAVIVPTVPDVPSAPPVIEAAPAVVETVAPVTAKPVAKKAPAKKAAPATKATAATKKAAPKAKP